MKKFFIVVLAGLLMQSCVNLPGRLDYSRVENVQCIESYIDFKEYEASRQFIYLPDAFLWFAGPGFLIGYSLIAFGLHTYLWREARNQLIECPFVK